TRRSFAPAGDRDRTVQSAPCWREASSSAQANCFGEQTRKGKSHRSTRRPSSKRSRAITGALKGEGARALPMGLWRGKAVRRTVGAVGGGIHAQCVHVVLPANEE